MVATGTGANPSGEITATVLFNVTVTCIPVDGEWFCVGKQTGIVSRGATEDEATDRNARMHQAIVRRLKKNGPLALMSFMSTREIEFHFDDRRQVVPNMHQVQSHTGTRKVLEAAA